MTILYFDIETTGLNYWEHGIIQLAGLFEEQESSNKITSDPFDLRMNPNAAISQIALKFSGIKEVDIQTYKSQDEVFKLFLEILKPYSNERITLCGYNNSSFDNLFLKEWFLQNGVNFYDYFYSNSIDVMILASEYLKYRRKNMNSFSLKSVAEYLQINVEESKLHNALYDILLTKKIYDSIKGRPSLLNLD